VWHALKRRDIIQDSFRKTPKRDDLDDLDDLAADGRITLKWILKIQDGSLWTGFTLIKIGLSGGAL
jgi:hypothetical protein